MRILISCLLVLLTNLCLRAAGQSTAPAVPDAEMVRDVEALRGKMAYHRARSAAWVDLAQFDQTVAELEHVNKAWQAIVTLTKDLPPDKKVALLTPIVNLPQETAAIRGQQRAFEVAVKQFNLPAETMGFVFVRDYEDVKPPLWAVAYRVRDKTLTSERMRANLDRYVAGEAMPESRAFVSAYQADGATAKRIHEVEIPAGMAPYYFVSRPGGFLFVLTAGLRNQGGLLLHDGKLVDLKGGPAKGSAIFPRASDKAIQHMAVNDLVTNLWAICPSDEDQLLAKYDSTQWDCALQVTVRKGHILRMEEGFGDTRRKIFELADGKRITPEQAKQLGAYYCLHRQMSRSGFLMLMAFPEPSSIKFDESSARWTLTYQRGRREIAGWFARVVLDAKGGLVDFSEQVVPR